MRRFIVHSVHFLLPVLFLIAPSGAAGQVTQISPLQGTVLDETGAPIVAARVTVRLDIRGAQPTTILTDGRGTFTLPVMPGPYAVRIESDGFDALWRDVTVEAGHSSVMDVVLKVAGFSDRVDVDARVSDPATLVGSATKTPTPLRDVPQAVSVVTRELIADQRMASMADVVRFMPGVTMAQGEGNRDTPILRGNASTSDFFVDGVRDDVQYFRDVYNVERVEALKGPNAMIFGRGGAGGVINRVTRQAEWGQSRELSVQLGSWDNRRLTADFGTAFNAAIAGRVTAVYENSDSYRSGVNLERYGVQPSVAFRLGPSTTLRGSYEYFHDERVADRGIPSFNGRPVMTEASTFFGNPAESPVEATVNVVASVLEHHFSDRITLRNRASYGLYDKFYQNVYPGAVNAAGTMVSISAYNDGFDRKNLFNQTDLLLRPRTGPIQHTLMVGAELGRQVTDNFRRIGSFQAGGSSVTSIQVPLAAPTVATAVTFPNAYNRSSHGTASVAAVYAQDQVELTSSWQAVAGLRFDAFTMTFTNNLTGAQFSTRDRLVSPRLGLIYRPTAPLSVYGSYSLTFVPRAGDQMTSLTLSNQALEPEQFRNYELGAKWDVRPALGVSAAVYRLDRGNVAVPHPTDPARAILIDAQRTKGLELEVNGALTSTWTLTAGYTFQDGSIRHSISSTEQAGADLAQVPSHAMSLWSKYEISPRWSAAVGVISRSAMFTSTDNRVVLPGFTRVDGAVFFDVTRGLRAQVNVENLFDESYYSSAHSNTNITPGSPRAMRFSLITRF